MSDKMRMSAYYYTFTPTGEPAVDVLLSAVACAGKAYHHTDNWTEPCHRPYEDAHRGESPVDWIQNAAVDAALELAAAKADAERLRALVENAEAILINCDVSTGVCCCGDAMDGHASPMSCGHSPVDMGEYTISGWIDEARAALAKEKAS